MMVDDASWCNMMLVVVVATVVMVTVLMVIVLMVIVVVVVMVVLVIADWVMIAESWLMVIIDADCWKDVPGKLPKCSSLC